MGDVPLLMARRWCTIVLAAWLLAPCGEVAAQEADEASDGTLRGELKRFLYDETFATVNTRSYYFDRQNPTPPTNGTTLATRDNISRLPCRSDSGGPAGTPEIRSNHCGG